jgi:hypothetical protein
MEIYFWRRKLNGKGNVFGWGRILKSKLCLRGFSKTEKEYRTKNWKVQKKSQSIWCL